MLKLLKSLWNSGTYQSIMLVLAGSSASLAGILKTLGCKVAESGVTTCLPQDAPFWFPSSFEPYLWVVAAAATALGLVERIRKGTAVTPSAPITNTGAVGTVTQEQVDAVSKPSKPKVNKDRK